MPKKEPFTFKRVEIGQKFSSDSNHPDCPSGNFRKASSSEAYAVNPNGPSQTHNKIKFSRSCAVKLIA